LDPRHDSAEAHGNIQGYDDEPDKGLCPVSRKSQERHRKGGLRPCQRRDCDRSSGGKQKDEFGQVVDLEVPAVFPQLKLADEDLRDDICRYDGELEHCHGSATK